MRLLNTTCLFFICLHKEVEIIKHTEDTQKCEHDNIISSENLANIVAFIDRIRMESDIKYWSKNVHI